MYKTVVVGDVLKKFLLSKGLLRRFKQNVVNHGFAIRNSLRRIKNSDCSAINSFWWSKDRSYEWCELDNEFNSLVDKQVKVDE